MKKLLFIGLAATAMLAGCSNDETVEMAQQNAIAFDGFVNKSTRGIANDITNDGTNGTTAFTTFKVWGLMAKDGQTGNPFVGTEVTKNGSNWTYTTPVYWENGYNYSFVALAPTSEADNFTAPTTVGEYGSIAFDNGDGTTDLIMDTDGTWATTAVSTENSCPASINFTFKHLLSRVKFQFTNGMDDGSVINVTEVKIKDANTKATAALSLDNATWTLDTDNLPQELSFGDVILEDNETNFAGNTTKETDHKYMIPALSDGQKYTVEFTVTRTFNGVTETYKPHEVQLPDVTMEQGHSYAFVATLKAENINPDAELCPIEFTATVSGWEDFNTPGTEILPEENVTE